MAIERESKMSGNLHTKGIMILSSFLKALPLKLLPSPPIGLPKRERSFVFQLESGGPFWEAICRSQTIAVYVPNEFRGLRFELVAM